MTESKELIGEKICQHMFSFFMIETDQMMRLKDETQHMTGRKR